MAEEGRHCGETCSVARKALASRPFLIQVWQSRHQPPQQLLQLCGVHRLPGKVGRERLGPEERAQLILCPGGDVLGRISNVCSGQWRGSSPWTNWSLPALGVLAPAQSCTVGQVGSPCIGRHWWQAAGSQRAATSGTGQLWWVLCAPIRYLRLRRTAMAMLRAGVSGISLPTGLGGSVSHKQGDFTGFPSNPTSRGGPPRSHTLLQVASPPNCSNLPFPNSAPP